MIFLLLLSSFDIEFFKGVFVAFEMSMSYHQSSVYITLSGKQVLSALCRTSDGEWIRSTIDLNTVLANSDGTFKWGTGGDFASSAKDVVLKDGRTLSAFLKRKDGTWSEKPAEVNLAEHITNNDGALRRCDRKELSIAPNFLEKFDAVSGVLRGQQIAAKNSAFELEFITASSNRRCMQELEVAFLRVAKLAKAIGGEFDSEEDEEADKKRYAAEAVLRPMIRAFEKVKARADKSLEGVSRICSVVSCIMLYEKKVVYNPSLKHCLQKHRRQSTRQRTSPY